MFESNKVGSSKYIHSTMLKIKLNKTSTRTLERQLSPVFGSIGERSSLDCSPLSIQTTHTVSIVCVTHPLYFYVLCLPPPLELITHSSLSLLFSFLATLIRNYVQVPFIGNLKGSPQHLSDKFLLCVPFSSSINVLTPQLII